MLSQETINKIAGIVKIKPEDLAAAIKDEKEVPVEIDATLHAFTETEVATLKNNEYKKGKETGVEMVVKDTKEKLGLDFQGKTIDGLIEAAKKKALEDAKIEPEKKVQELELKLKTAQTTATELQTKLAEKETEVSSVKTQTLIAKDLPTNTTLPADKIILLMKADGYDFKNENGKIIWLKNGEAVTDKLGNNRETKDITSEYITTNKLSTEAAPPGGRGGSGGGGGIKYTKLSEIKEDFNKNGKSLMGDEFKAAYAQAVKEYPELDLNA